MLNALETELLEALASASSNAVDASGATLLAWRFEDSFHRGLAYAVCHYYGVRARTVAGTGTLLVWLRPWRTLADVAPCHRGPHGERKRRCAGCGIGLCRAPAPECDPAGDDSGSGRDDGDGDGDDGDDDDDVVVLVVQSAVPVAQTTMPPVRLTEHLARTSKAARWRSEELADLVLVPPHLHFECA